MTLQEVIEVGLRIVQVELFLVHLFQVFELVATAAFGLSCLARRFELAPRRRVIVLESVVAVEVFDAIVVIALVRIAHLILDVALVGGRFLANFRRLQFLTGGDYGRLGRLFHLLLEFFEVLLALLFAFLFALLCALYVDSELVAQVVRKFKLLVLNVRLRLFLYLLLSDVLLQVAQEEEALAELDVLHQGLRQAVAYLF